MDLGLVGFDSPVPNNAPQSILDDGDDSKYSAKAIADAKAMIGSADYEVAWNAFKFLRDMPDAIKVTVVRDVITLPEPLIDWPASLAFPPADVNQLPNAYEFIIDTPGFKSGDINVLVEEEDNVVVVTGKRKREEKEEGVKRVRPERFGEFKSSFYLPDDEKTSAISAFCQDGVLTVTVTVEKLPPPPSPQPMEPITSEVKVG